MKTKLFYLQGCDLEILNDIEEPNYYLSQKNLEPYVDFITLGIPTTGFKITDLVNLFSSYDLDLPFINIIFSGHGGIRTADNKYYIVTQGTAIPLDYQKIEEDFAHVKEMFSDETTINLIKKNMFQVKYEKVYTPLEELITEIVITTKNKPLKILTTSCLGANWHKTMNLLPPESVIITLSEKDTVTSMDDLKNIHYKFILENLFAKGFKLENLVEAYCLSQKFLQNSPIISKKDDNGTIHTIDLKQYAQKHLTENTNFSCFFKTYINQYNLLEEYLIKLINKVQNETIESLKFPADLFSIIFEQELTYFRSIQKLENSIEGIPKNEYENQLDDLNKKLNEFYSGFFKKYYLWQDNIKFESINFYNSPLLECISTPNMLEVQLNLLKKSEYEEKINNLLIKNNLQNEKYPAINELYVSLNSFNLPDQNELLDLLPNLQNIYIFESFKKTLYQAQIVKKNYTLLAINPELDIDFLPDYNLLLSAAADDLVFNKKFDFYSLTGDSPTNE